MRFRLKDFIGYCKQRGFVYNEYSSRLTGGPCGVCRDSTQFEKGGSRSDSFKKDNDRMKGLKIENRDIVRVDGKPVVIEGLEYYSQRIKHSIRLCLGESFYESLKGVDWNTIFSSKISKDRVLFEIQKVLQRDPETVSVENIEIVDELSSNRKLNIRFYAITVYGLVSGEI